MRVDVECGLEIRVPEKCLGGLDGLADFTEQGSVGVTEGVPADGRESESAACWSKVPMRQVRRVQGGIHFVHGRRDRRVLGPRNAPPRVRFYGCDAFLRE